MGRHHRIFVSDADRNTSAYADFWDALKRGEYQSGEYRRIRKSGQEMWLQATYNPIFDASGRPFKVVKFCTVINSINDISNGIAAAIEEQGAVTQEISSNMLTASHGVQTITDNMTRIAGATEAASASARSVMEASKTLVA